MTQVVVFTHEDIRCALPAAQVVRASASDSAPSIQLWARTRSDEEEPRALLVETRVGRRRVASADTRFEMLDEATMLPLPELLSASMALPHVVGVATTGETTVWLVDLAKWEER